MKMDGKFSPTPDAAYLAWGLDAPEIRQPAIGMFVGWMLWAPQPLRAQAAFELCRHSASIAEAYPAEWRAIVAEAVEVVGEYAEGLEGHAAP